MHQPGHASASTKTLDGLTRVWPALTRNSGAGAVSSFATSTSITWPCVRSARESGGRSPSTISAFGPQRVGDDPLRDLSPLPGAWGRCAREDGASTGDSTILVVCEVRLDDRSATTETDPTRHTSDHFKSSRQLCPFRIRYCSDSR